MFRMWCTVPRGTHTMSSLAASTTTPPVSSHCRRPPSTTHHSSNSRCQCGRLPPPGGEAMRVTRLRSSAMIRLDQGGRAHLGDDLGDPGAQGVAPPRGGGGTSGQAVDDDR